MGIKDLNPFLNKRMLRTRSIPLVDFSGRIIAIDAHNVMIALFIVANKVVARFTQVDKFELDKKAIINKWTSMCLDIVVNFFSHGVTPVFVFDGKHPPEKAETQSKRRQQREADKEEARKLKDELSSMSLLDRNKDKIERLRQLLSRCNYLEKDDIQGLKNLFEELGIPILQAIGEAEDLCASLAYEGLVSAVYSTDTDNLVYGCPLVITDIGEFYRDEKHNQMMRKATCVALVDVLKTLKWNQETFVDFCITLGCDFNQRIKGLGPETAYKLIDEHGKIESFPSKYNTELLKYQRCREIFQHRKPQHVIEDDVLDIKPERLQVNKKLLSLGCHDFLKETFIGDMSFYKMGILNSSLNLPEVAKDGKFEIITKKKVVIKKIPKSEVSI